MITAPKVKIPAAMRVSHEQFLQIVRANPDLRLELTSNGKLIGMAPTGSEGGQRNAEIGADLVIWNRKTKLGVVFDSSTGFTLPNGAIRSPDVAWIARDRWEALTPDQKKGFAPICPDFVLELASESDDIKELQAKLQEYIENGARLGWLIDPRSKRVWIYRPSQPVESLQNPTALSGENVLVGLKLSLPM
ncbi:MAG: Uma2 family endonuclease [Leptolyngbya sp. SIO4C1]|nr:Uma2 family endonuclease [Leptolyngbya sp. SIO4C1]